MTEFLLPFSVVLLAAVLVSSLAHRTVLSTAALFLVAGIALGEGGFGVLDIALGDPLVATIANIALFTVLFSDGTRVGWSDLKSAWRLPGRALLLGMPITMVLTALGAHYLLGLGWAASFLIGAILSPTDPVFASALVGNKKVPPRLRSLLNVESGVNDGLALPFVMVFLATAAGSHDTHMSTVALELVLGLVIGVAVPAAALALEKTRFFESSTAYLPLNGLAIGLLVFAIASNTHANLYLASFAAGITVATLGERQRHAFEEFGELLAEVFKLAALLVFGALVGPTFLSGIGVSVWIFAVFALLVPRPAALAVSFARSGLSVREQTAAAWFGPKGFASVVYGLLVVESHIGVAEEVFAAVAATIVLSILAHSSTDVVVARWFDDEHETPAWHRRRTAPGRGRRTETPTATTTGTLSYAPPHPGDHDD